MTLTAELEAARSAWLTAPNHILPKQAEALADLAREHGRLAIGTSGGYQLGVISQHGRTWVIKPDGGVVAVLGSEEEAP